QERGRSRRVRREELLDLVRIDAASADAQVVDRPPGLESERNADVAKLEVAVDNHGLPPGERKRDGEIAGGERLAGAAFRADDRDQRAECRRFTGCAASAGDSLLEGEGERVPSLWQYEQVVDAGRECPLEVAVRVAGVQYDDRTIRVTFA